MNWNPHQPSLQLLKATLSEQWQWFIAEQPDDLASAQQHSLGGRQKAQTCGDDEAEQRLSAWQQQQRAKFRKPREPFSGC